MTGHSEDESLTIEEEQSIVRVRQAVRKHARELGFGLVDQTKLVTAASELARNCYVHGGGGVCRLVPIRAGARAGLKLEFEDRGPGIDNVEQAMRDGYTTLGGLGLGLGGARRLVHEFEIESQPEQGTKVTAVRWR